MERMIREKICSHLFDLGLISAHQHGFVTKKSCVRNLLQTLDYVTKCIEEGSPVDVIYLDFAKAFDRVCHRLLVKKLDAYGISGACLN